MITKALFAARLRQFREGLRMTQPDLAKRLDVSRNTIITWEDPTKRNLPDAEQFDALLAVSIQPVTAAWFFTEDSRHGA